MSNEGKDSFL